MNPELPPHHAPTGLKLWLAVFGVVLVIALSYLVWAQNTSPDTADNSTVVTKKTTTDETADWKVLTKYFDTASGEQGYSIQYPIDWEVSSEDLNSAAAIWEYGLRPASLKNDYLVGISYYDSSLSEATEIVKGIYTPNFNFLGQTSVPIGKEAGTRLDFSSSISSSLKPSSYLVEKCNDGCFTVGISGSGSVDNEETEAIIQKIIGTFQLVTKN